MCGPMPLHMSYIRPCTRLFACPHFSFPPCHVRFPLPALISAPNATFYYWDYYTIIGDRRWSHPGENQTSPSHPSRSSESTRAAFPGSMSGTRRYRSRRPRCSWMPPSQPHHPLSLKIPRSDVSYRNLTYSPHTVCHHLSPKPRQ